MPFNMAAAALAERAQPSPRVHATQQLVLAATAVLWLRLLANFALGWGAFGVAAACVGTAVLGGGVGVYMVYGALHWWLLGWLATALLLPFASWVEYACGSPGAGAAAAARDLAWPFLAAFIAAAPGLRGQTGPKYSAASVLTCVAELLAISALGWHGSGASCGRDAAPPGDAAVTHSFLATLLLLCLGGVVLHAACAAAAPLPTRRVSIVGSNMSSPAARPMGRRRSKSSPLDATDSSSDDEGAVTPAPPPAEACGVPAWAVASGAATPPVAPQRHRFARNGTTLDIVQNIIQNLSPTEETVVPAARPPPAAKAPAVSANLPSRPGTAGSTAASLMTVEDSMLFHAHIARTPTDEVSSNRFTPKAGNPLVPNGGRQRLLLRIHAPRPGSDDGSVVSLDAPDSGEMTHSGQVGTPGALGDTWGVSSFASDSISHTGEKPAASTAAVAAAAALKAAAPRPVLESCMTAQSLAYPHSQTSGRPSPHTLALDTASAITSNVLLTPARRMAKSPRAGEKRSERSFTTEVRVLWKALDNGDHRTLDRAQVQDLLDVLGVGFTSAGDGDDFLDSVEVGRAIGREEFIAAFEAFRLGNMFSAHHSRIRLAAMAGVFNGGTLQERVARTWSDFDEDGDGTLDKEEIVPILRTLGLPHEEEDIMELFLEFNHNPDPTYIPDRIEYNDFISVFSTDRYSALHKKSAFAMRMDEAAGVLVHANTWLASRAAANTRLMPYTEAQESEIRRDNRRKKLNEYLWVVFIYAVFTFAYSTFRIVWQVRVGPLTSALLCSSDVILWLWLYVKHFLAPSKNSLLRANFRDLARAAWMRPDVILDVLIAAPADWVGLILEGAGYDPVFRVNKFLIMFYVPLLFRGATERLSPMPVRIFGSLAILFMQAHLLACLFKLTADHVGDEAVMVVTTLGRGNTTAFSDLSIELQYTQSFDYAMKTMTGWGRGDAIPWADENVLLAMLTVMTGVASYAYVLAAISNALQIPSVENIFKEKMEEVKGFFNYTDMPSDLRDECLSYYKHAYNTNNADEKGEEEALLAELPHELEVMLRLLDTRRMLGRVPIFADTINDNAFVYALALKFKPGTFCPGELVCAQGAPGSTMYFITHGACEILNADGCVFHTLERGNFFGEIAILHNVRRTATIRARTFTNVLVLEKADFEEVGTQFPDSLSSIREHANERIKLIVHEEQRQKRFSFRRLVDIASSTATTPGDPDADAPPPRSNEGVADAAFGPLHDHRPGTARSETGSVTSTVVNRWLDNNREDKAGRDEKRKLNVLSQIKRSQRKSIFVKRISMPAASMALAARKAQRPSTDSVSSDVFLGVSASEQGGSPASAPDLLESDLEQRMAMSDDEAILSGEGDEAPAFPSPFRQNSFGKPSPGSAHVSL